MSRGNGYLGSPSIQVSKANQEIIPTSPSNWTDGYKMQKLSFDNEQACSIVINKEVTLFLKAGQGFEIDYGDVRIFSLKIVEKDINYNWIGIY